MPGWRGGGARWGRSSGMTKNGFSSPPVRPRGVGSPPPPAFYGLGAAALATSLVTLRRRLELSKAKHRTLTGHARMARRVAALVPFYGYDEDRFFCSDDAPEEIVSRRRAGFKRLAALYDTHFAETIRLTAAVTDGISDLQFTDAYRVPFQYGGVVRP